MCGDCDVTLDNNPWKVSCLYKTCVLDASTASSGVEKYCPLSLFLWSQDYTVDDSSNRCFECSKMQLFRCVGVRLRLLATTDTLMVVYHSEFPVLRCSSGMVASCPVFPKNQETICFEVLCARTTFVSVELLAELI